MTAGPAKAVDRVCRERRPHRWALLLDLQGAISNEGERPEGRRYEGFENAACARRNASPVCGGLACMQQQDRVSGCARRTGGPKSRSGRWLLDVDPGRRLALVLGPQRVWPAWRRDKGRKDLPGAGRDWVCVCCHWQLSRRGSQGGRNALGLGLQWFGPDWRRYDPRPDIASPGRERVRFGRGRKAPYGGSEDRWDLVGLGRKREWPTWRWNECGKTRPRPGGEWILIGGCWLGPYGSGEDRRHALGLGLARWRQRIRKGSTPHARRGRVRECCRRSTPFLGPEGERDALGLGQ